MLFCDKISLKIESPSKIESPLNQIFWKSFEKQIDERIPDWLNLWKSNADVELKFKFVQKKEYKQEPVAEYLLAKNKKQIFRPKNKNLIEYWIKKLP